MTALAALIAGAEPAAGGFRVTIPESWQQGRTAYGGLSSALALHAAMHSDTDLPPLRSATVNFVGPLAGAVTVTATRLRRGRNAAFIQSDIVSEAGLGYRATFVFMANQPSRIALDKAPRAPLPPPTASDRPHAGPVPSFIANFDLIEQRDGLGEAEWLRWGRLREGDGLDPMVELMAIADFLPPAAYKLLGKERAPISSLTWILNLLTATPATDDGWWLLSANADVAQHGSSSQLMRVWNARGDLVAEGMQSVAIFA